jgi:hypothetical protein
MYIICIKLDMCILIVSSYHPQVRRAHQTGSGRGVILADPDFHIVGPIKMIGWARFVI